MFYRWKTRRRKERFYNLTRDILNTSPIEVQFAPWSIVSMVSNSDVQMYILSMKSFYTRITKGKLIAIVDRDMPIKLRDMLKHHFVGIEFVNLEDIDTGGCQRGGTWERLIFLLDRSSEEYMIQVDCDTLAFGENVDEVLQYAKNNTPFTLGGAHARPIESLQSIADNARHIESNYIGIVAERLFDQYPGAEEMKYVRGSSGLAGFSKGGFTRTKIEDFHRIMDGMIGARWTEWGTEQNGSNFAIANSPGAKVLPFPEYSNFLPSTDRERSKFLHFIGTYRFMDNYFATLGQRVINELMSPRGL